VFGPYRNSIYYNYLFCLDTYLVVVYGHFFPNHIIFVLDEIVEQGKSN
jgi:hypothetical protein